MIGLKDQCFGVEVEMTGITREQAARALADYFGTVAVYSGGVYDSWAVPDTEGKTWKRFGTRETWGGESIITGRATML